MAVGVSRVNGERTWRWCFFAYLSSTNTPLLPSSAGTALEPSFQSRWITFVSCGSAPVKFSIDPKTRAEPARIPETAVTSGAFAAACSAAIVSGVNVSWEVSA